MPTTGTARPSSAPLELLGTSAGLSVVDPATILTRLWYFDGRFLRAEGFRLDQDYVRALAALSHQATGTGVVHGFDVTRPTTGDDLRIAGGLALAPSGRVVYLPREVRLGIGELIARSDGTFDPGSPAEPGVADFRRCPPEVATGPDITLAERPLYVLTVAGVEALCGEEERFGQLCVDACATETDRSTVVEGVVFRVRELTLVLPVSSAVPFDGRHLRSRVASAYFAAERTAVPSRISGAGLATPVWCAGAEAVGGEEVALAVLDRAGGVTALLDGWSARRELQETGPRTYWAWRTAMRPWDVFLAQVLQFQCHLLDLGAPGSDLPGPDPCAGERETLTAVADLLGGIAADPDGRLAAVRTRIAAAMGRPRAVAGTGSLLMDGGIVELPPAGYLPVSLSRPVAAQVRALFGPGVQLRFCVTRPDCVPELLHQAQHLDRISLFRGLDDPEQREQVDVMVPDGVLGAPAQSVTAFTGEARVFPGRRRPDGEPESALSLSVVARDRSADGWSWVAAGYGEAPRQLSAGDLADAALRAMREAPPGDSDEQPPPEREDPFDRIPLRPDSQHDRARRTAAFTQRLVAEGRAATAHRAAVLASAGSLPRDDRAPREGEDLPFAIWVDAATATALDALPIGGVTDVRARATLHLRGDSAPVFLDARLTGTLRVVDALTVGDRRSIRTVLDGVAELVQNDADRPRLEAVRGFALTWTVAAGARTLTVGAGDPVVVVATVKEERDPRRVSGQVLQRRTVRERRSSPALAAAADRPLGSFQLREQVGVLAPGSTDRALAESVIAVLGAELAAPALDPTFAQYATERLLGGLTAVGDTEVTATKDWVFFTRRRTVTCVGDATPPAVRTRTYRLFHRRQDDQDRTVMDRLRVPDPSLRAGALGFEPVATVTFPEGQTTLTSSAAELRAGWSAADRGRQIFLAGVGDFTESDGEPIALGRLATVRTVLADLADSTQAQVQYLPQIPDEFHQAGLDGAMFTVGTAGRTETCVTVFRLLREAQSRIVDVLRQRGDTVSLAEVFRLADVQLEPLTAHLVDDEVVEPDAVRAEWQGLRFLQGVLAVPSGLEEAEITDRRSDATRVADVIGLQAIDEERLAAQTGDCRSVLLVAVEPIIG